MTTETTQQEIILLPELPPVPSRTEDEQATYNTKAFNFRAAERELQQKFNINVPLLNTVLKSSTDILPNMDAIENVAGNMVNITSVAAHSSDITTVAVNMPAVLDAPNRRRRQDRARWMRQQARGKPQHRKRTQGHRKYRLRRLRQELRSPSPRKKTTTRPLCGMQRAAHGFSQRHLAIRHRCRSLSSPSRAW